jgi:hypothetical protein
LRVIVKAQEPYLGSRSARVRLYPVNKVAAGTDLDDLALRHRTLGHWGIGQSSHTHFSMLTGYLS